jgi:O-antigen ligase
VNLRRILTPSMPREMRQRPTPSGGGRLWRYFLGGLAALGIGTLVADIVWAPSKRNIEILAAVLFLGSVVAADAFKTLLFAIIIIPFPAYTSVGSTSMLLILAIAGLVMMKSKQLRLPSPFVRKDADLAVMGWGLMVVLSFYEQPSGVAREVRLITVGLASAVVLYYMVIYLVNDLPRLWQTIVTSQVVATLLAMLGIYQWFFPNKQILPAFFSFSRKVASMQEIRRGEVRVTGTFDGKELFAEYLALSLILQYFLARRAKSIHAKAFWICSMLLVVACLFATATRGALIVLVGGFVYMLLFGQRAVPRGQILKVVFVAIAVFYLALGLVQPLVSFMMNRIQSIGMQDESVGARMIVLRQAMQGVADSPFLGHGIVIPPGTFHGFVDRNIHNLYLTLAYTVGLPGLIAFVWFLVILYRLSAATMRDMRLSREHRELALCLNTLLVMFCVDEIKIEYVRQPLYMHITWLLFAWVLCVWKIGARARSQVELDP